MTSEYFLIILLCWLFVGMVATVGIALCVVVIEDLFKQLFKKTELMPPDIKVERF